MKITINIPDCAIKTVLETADRWGIRTPTFKQVKKRMKTDKKFEARLKRFFIHEFDSILMDSCFTDSLDASLEAFKDEYITDLFK